MTDKKVFRLGLIGKDVEKSLSPEIHAFILGAWGYGCEYEKFSLAATDLDGVVGTLLGDFDGFNVTIPYKRDIMEYLDGLQGDAMRFGAVNTVVCATRQGHNTDGVGFLKMLKDASVEVKGKKVLVLGGGGAGRSTISTLKKAGATVALYQRNEQKRKETCLQLDAIEEADPNLGGYDILVNCTGVGMHDTVGQSPVLASAFAGAQSAVDLIYEPKETAFMAEARAQGLRTVGGLAMLFYQAYYADCLYLQKKADEQEATDLYKRYLTTFKRG